MSQLRRRILLINRPFQIRFAFYVCSWLFVLSVIYPMLVSQLYDWFYRYLAADPNGPMIPFLQKSRKDMLFWLTMMQVCFMVMTFLMSLFMSHRIAGPLYKLGKALNELRNGNLSKITFRKADHFQELAADYNYAVESVSDQILASRAHLERALAASKDEESRREIDRAIKSLDHFHQKRLGEETAKS
jgi:methyl-accepting chemotaxis protein